MANNSKQCFNTHYQPHCHPTTKSLWLCSSVYCRPPHQSRRIWLVAAATNQKSCDVVYMHDDVIKWKHFPRNWPFVRKIHRSPVNFPHKGQWRGALMFSLIYAWINDWANNREAGDLRRQHGHYDVIIMVGRYSCKTFASYITSVHIYDAVVDKM